jgi:conjugal transfer pilus assembly protein TraF
MMMDKAQVFSDIAREVVTSDPLLDENLRVPIASAAKASVMLQVKKDTQDILKGLNEKAGIWVFHDPSCSFCEDQVNPINELAKRHGLNIVYISKDGSPVRGLDPSIPVRRADGRFERLGVKYTPSVMMVVPPDGYYLISQGFAGLPTLESRMINVAHRYGLIDEEEYYRANPTARGVMKASLDKTENQDVDWNSAEDWVPYLQKLIGDTYGIGEGDE